MTSDEAIKDVINNCCKYCWNIEKPTEDEYCISKCGMGFAVNLIREVNKNGIFAK